MSNYVPSLETPFNFFWGRIIKRSTDLKEALKKLKNTNLVIGIQVDQKGRYVVKTKPLYVTINKVDRIIGKYQIRIDFHSSYNPIQILNISQRNDEYDSLYVDKTIACFGNITDEVSALWERKDLVGLVDSILYFIVRSTKGQNLESGWKHWLRNATPTPRGFNFKQYDAGKRQISPSELNFRVREEREQQKEYQKEAIKKLRRQMEQIL